MTQPNTLTNKVKRRGVALLNLLRYGGIKGRVRTLEYSSAHPARWHLSFKSSRPTRHPPKRFGEAIAKFDLEDTPYPALGVLEIPHAWVFGATGWTFTPEGYFLADSSWYGMADEMRLPRVFRKPRQLKGTCLTLMSDFSQGNYGHFVLDCLTRYGIFQKAGLDVRDVDHIYLPKPVSPTARTIMLEMGIPEEKCVWAQPEEIIRADRMLATSFPGRRRDYAPWIPEFLQQGLKPGVPQSHRVYIPRDGVRRASNESELIEIASAFGFSEFDYRHCAHEPSFFHSADAIIGAHGAGLTNLAYCKPGTKVLELIPSDHVHPYFYTLADSGRLDYGYLVGNSAQNRPPGTRGPSPHDFRVDPHVFENALKSMFP